jgi:GAF domain-containing protein
MDWAVADCRLALDIAARHGFSWLEAAASRTWTEIALARDDVAGAIRSTRHGLALAERIHARAQARQAHLQLAQLLQREGDTDGSLHHLWQHLTLQGEIERLSLAAEGAPGTTPAPISPEERLLQLSARRRHLYARGDRTAAWDELQAAARQALGVQAVLLGRLRHADAQRLTLPPASELRVERAGQPNYLALLERHGGPLGLPDASLHPCHNELAALAPSGQARIELPLFDGPELAGVLWLVDATPHRNWSRQDLLLANQLGLLAEGLLFG